MSNNRGKKMQLSITSVAPYFILMALFMMLGTLLMRLPFFAASGQSLAASLYEALDGLRGYLALTVFIHRAVARYFYEANAVWECTYLLNLTFCDHKRARLAEAILKAKASTCLKPQ